MSFRGYNVKEKHCRSVRYLYKLQFISHIVFLFLFLSSSLIKIISKYIKFYFRLFNVKKKKDKYIFNTKPVKFFKTFNIFEIHRNIHGMHVYVETLVLENIAICINVTVMHYTYF